MTNPNPECPREDCRFINHGGSTTSAYYPLSAEFSPKLWKYLNKKIKRRIFYEVIWWMKDGRKVKYFESAKKMRKFVNHLHSWYNDYIEIEKNWCYRQFTPKHKWYYISYRPNQFVCVEKY